MIAWQYNLSYSNSMAREKVKYSNPWQYNVSYSYPLTVQYAVLESAIYHIQIAWFAVIFIAWQQCDPLYWWGVRGGSGLLDVVRRELFRIGQRGIRGICVRWILCYMTMIVMVMIEGRSEAQRLVVSLRYVLCCWS